MNEDSGSKAAAAQKAPPLGELEIPPSLDGVADRPCTHDEVTRRIRFPLLESSSALPEAEAAADGSTPMLPLSVLPADPDETPLPPGHDRSPPLDSHDDAANANPFESPFSEVSRNIHHIPTPMPGLADEADDSPPRPKRHGLIVVAAVVIAGVAVDAFLWMRTGEGAAEPSSPHAAATDVPVRFEDPASKLPVPVIAPLPARSHIEISVQADDATLVLDGKPLQGNLIELDVPTDQDPHVLEVTAPGFAPLKRTVSFAKDLYLAIELQRMVPASRTDQTAPPPVVKPKKSGRAHAAEATDDFGSPFVPTPTKRPPTTIDETDPYAP